MTNKSFIYIAETNALKSGAVSMNAVDWKTMFGALDSDDLTEHGAYQAVSWVSRCVRMRCNALSAIPAKIYHAKRDSGKEVPWEFADALPDILWMTEGSAQLYGAAYWLREENLVKDKGYRWLAPSTITPKYSAETGLVAFERRLPNRPMQTLKPIKDILYYWESNLEAETGPGKGWVSTILTESGVAHAMNEFVSGFFERGAIPAVLLSVEGNPPKEELDRLEQWWKRMLQGVKRAWETVAVRATVKPVVIGYPTKDLAMPALLQAVRQQIAVAAGVPQTMLEDAANFACLPGDQLVWTPMGPRPIGELKTGDAIWQSTEAGIVTNTVEAIIPQGLAPVYEIKTPRRRLRASDNHPVLCVSIVPGRGLYDPQRSYLVWKRADQIQCGDLVVSVEECPDQGRTEVNGMALTEEFMELAGLYVGDGDGSERDGLRYTIPEGPVQDYYAASAERVFQPSCTLGKSGQGCNRDYGPVHSRKRHYIFIVGSKPGYCLLRELGFTGNARSKRVPAWVFELALPLRLAFLRGYLDSDGTVGKDGRLAFGACNRALIDDIRMLFVSCGIPVSNVRSDVGRMGNMGPIELYRFVCSYPPYNRMVGSHDPRHVERLGNERKSHYTGRYMPGITGTVWNLTLPPGLGLERVVSVRHMGEEEVYDLATTGPHTFVAEGIVVHNTSAEHHQAFYMETIVPEAIRIQGWLNRQLFGPQGLRVVLDWQALNIFQEDEAARAVSLNQLVTAGIPLDMAMEMLGMDLPGEMSYDQFRQRLEEDKAKAAERQRAAFAARPPEPGQTVPAQADQAEQREELRRWQRKALKGLGSGKGAAVDFESDVLTDEEQHVIAGRLASAATEEEVKAAFVGPFRTESLPYP